MNMKRYILFLLVLSLSLLSCSKSDVELISDKLNELTGNPDFSKNKVKELRDGYYVIYITKDEIKNDRTNYGILFELQDYIYNELNIVSYDEKSLLSDNLEILYETDESIITTKLKNHDIGPKNHPIWIDDCIIEIKRK